ncbi:DUF2213 domain-containing protein [Acinetobacter towneri]|uniref:DUF2213 domain-containing protein n=1 Tax=Acinetobacter towneri TaxID=202956 RepID=UPI001CE1EC36|nr:DUF2213 domain-containing protein [Acinetobacter towneri]MCA4780265.1 DUF2213 domain-containing protein [Acinetobacter towneri]MCA4785677.1 DUF2213 domain-containing protein [Acinetobacter towneri]MCA4787489.1 DUF2213 domain-containing protein [Acinetobacter towneri]MCA4796771.1 DUF2213 domain-containing protein [Acinetobacter towneri]MCA4801818.1 DUF2213 domain-containing protein [Acinetobacter towneri]
MLKKKPKKPAPSATKDRSNIYTTGQIGRTRETTPEGYLLCRDVPVARIGTLMYGDGEVPVKADSTGLILIQRGEEDLFDPKTMASFEGKAVTNDHPEDWVSPSNWKELAVGTAHSVRRGEGAEADFLIADLLITDQDAIDAVMGEKVEISLGYDADYVEISPGKGVQRNIFGNHVALVDKGRCGSRCSIGDSFMSGKTNKKPWYQALLGAKRTIDEALEEAKETQDTDEETEDEDEEQDGKTSDAAVNRQILKMLKTMDSRLGALEKKTKDSDEKTEDEDDKEETKDLDEEESETKDDILEAESAEKMDTGVTHTGDSLKEVMVRAEILSPGIKLPPTIDSANNGKAVVLAKRQALKAAMQTTDGQKAVAPFIGANANIDTLSIQTLDAAFIGASELIKQQNNLKGVRSGVTTRDFGRAAPTIDQINQRNRDFWNKGK